MFHYFLQMNFATILISVFMLIFVNVNPVFQRKDNSVVFHCDKLSTVSGYR